MIGCCNYTFYENYLHAFMVLLSIQIYSNLLHSFSDPLEYIEMLEENANCIWHRAGKDKFKYDIFQNICGCILFGFIYLKLVM